MTDILPTPSALEIRDELEAMMRRDLLGPAGGPEEIVTVKSPKLVPIKSGKLKGCWPQHRLWA
jgi:hypothetical protein